MSLAITLIYARAANGVIGTNGTLAWHIPADLKHFKALTMGRPMVMGRKTFESLPGILPGRRHIVLTRQDQWRADKVETARTVAKALELAAADNPSGEVAVIGGAAIYDLFMPLADAIELTEVHRSYDGDTFMPALGNDWEETSREDHWAAGDLPAYSFVTYHRPAGHRPAGETT